MSGRTCVNGGSHNPWRMMFEVDSCGCLDCETVWLLTPNGWKLQPPEHGPQTKTPVRRPSKGKYQGRKSSLNRRTTGR